MVVIGLNLKIEKRKGVRKVQQIVWIPYETFQWILKICSEVDEAPNTVISLLLDRMREHSEKGEFQPVKVVEKVVTKGYKCPFCDKLFAGAMDVIDHLSEHREEIKSILEYRR